MLPKACSPGKYRVKGKCLTAKQLQRFIHKLSKEEGYGIKTPYLVNTPKPYIIDMNSKSPDLDMHTRKLWDIIEKLGISESTAVKRQYSLNTYTIERLENIAFNQSKYDILKEINKLR